MFLMRMFFVYKLGLDDFSSNLVTQKENGGKVFPCFSFFMRFSYNFIKILFLI